MRGTLEGSAEEEEKEEHSTLVDWIREAEVVDRKRDEKAIVVRQKP